MLKLLFSFLVVVPLDMFQSSPCSSRNFAAMNMRTEDGLSMVTKVIIKQEEPESESVNGARKPPTKTTKMPASTLEFEGFWVWDLRLLGCWGLGFGA